MEYFAGLDVSMKETHVCVVAREGDIVLETSTSTLPEAIAAALARAGSPIAAAIGATVGSGSAEFIL